MHPSNDTEVFSTTSTLSTDGVQRRLCEPWVETRHFLLQAAHFCFAAAFVVPTVRRQAAQFLVRVLLTLGFLSAGVWAALKSCTGPDVLAWNTTLLVANCAQAAYVAYRNLPPRIAPEFQELYLKVFHPLKVGKDQFRQLVRYAHVEPLEPGEHYAMEGVSYTDQRLAILLSGKMKVTCEEILLHYLLPTEFVDSPEWESCDVNTDKRFQVTLTAIERCQLLCWGRKELLTILENNQFLNFVMYNLIGKDITHKLYSLNDQHRKDTAPEKLSIADSLDFWRSPMARCHSVDMVHTSKKGQVRSLFWKKPEKKNRRMSSLLADHLGDSRTSNFSDPGPRQKRKGEKQQPQQQQQRDPPFATPV
ncbi:blood vessel epicardial substance [Parasteatoda tepidariorum]|uniref:blood vessel epicardial substance n=1 Tax=Parasteatoda tepidariorum TaxID=114398 RepID=UPI00077FB3A7|nr:blood vessel epicardial substance [Parasteatoda tepidariorum]XP_015903380.1 blood vessel epicardial substance [Parasteatoda tepidariorum]XP_015903381.1 blood vessel epicardial substance [Parasteatoda tepidariorum]XP_042899822.1 blood vessel epicardial substance [Parasteatoda tepidariorum]